MATPHVAGVAAALAWAKNPAVSVAAVKNALLNGGDAIPSLDGTDRHGAAAQRERHAGADPVAADRRSSPS